MINKVTVQVFTESEEGKRAVERCFPHYADERVTESGITSPHLQHPVFLIV